MRPYKTFLIAFTLFASALFFYDPLDALSETDYISMPILQKISQYITNDSYTELRISSIPKQGATNGQALVWNESAGSWLPGAVAGAADGTNDLIATQQDVIDAINNENINPGDVNFTGDVEGPRAHFEMATNINLVVTDSFIGPVGLDQLLQGGATSGNVLKWSGADWEPGTVESGGGVSLSVGKSAQWTIDQEHLNVYGWTSNPIDLQNTGRRIWGWTWYVPETIQVSELLVSHGYGSSWPAGETITTTIMDMGEYVGRNPAYWPDAATNDVNVIAQDTVTSKALIMPDGWGRIVYDPPLTLEAGHTYLYRNVCTVANSTIMAGGIWNNAVADLGGGYFELQPLTSNVFVSTLGTVGDLRYRPNDPNNGHDWPAAFHKIAVDTSDEPPVSYVQGDRLTIVDAYDEETETITFSAIPQLPKFGTAEQTTTIFGNVAPSSSGDYQTAYNPGVILQRFQALRSGQEINGLVFPVWFNSGATVKITVYKDLDYSAAIAESDVVDIDGANTRNYAMLTSSFVTEVDALYDFMIEMTGRPFINIASASTWPDPDSTFRLASSIEFTSVPSDAPPGFNFYRTYGWGIAPVFVGEDVVSARTVYLDGLTVTDEGDNAITIALDAGPFFTDGTNLFWVNSLGTTNALTSN